VLSHPNGGVGSLVWRNERESLLIGNLSIEGRRALDPDVTAAVRSEYQQRHPRVDSDMIGFDRLWATADPHRVLLHPIPNN